MPLQPSHSDLHSVQSVIFNGHVYKSLGSHDPHSTQVIGQYTLYDLDPAWHICSPTPDALHVCAAYPWAAYALVFADGSAYFTANGPQFHATNHPGQQIFSTGCLLSKIGKYGTYPPFAPCVGARVPRARVPLGADVLSARKLKALEAFFVDNAASSSAGRRANTFSTI